MVCGHLALFIIGGRRSNFNTVFPLLDAPRNHNRNFSSFPSDLLVALTCRPASTPGPACPLHSCPRVQLAPVHRVLCTFVPGDKGYLVIW